jgi:glycosyltransferase involved in cell wall biosynthesis
MKSSLRNQLINLLLPHGTRRHLLARKMRDQIRGKKNPAASIELKKITLELNQFINMKSVAEADCLVLLISPSSLDPNEGQRSTSLAFEFSRRNIPVIFAYWRWHPGLLQEQQLIEQNIFQLPVDMLASHPELVFRQFSNAERLVLFEFPHPSLFDALAEAHACGWICIYDLIDDWDEFNQVGQAVWYEPQFERHLYHSADAIIAVSPRLIELVEISSKRKATLIPNGLAPWKTTDLPRQLKPTHNFTIGYFGYLSPAWFDWELLRLAAEQRVNWRWEIIGYGAENQTDDFPPNIHFLGKKPRRELPGFAMHWDAAIVPFKQTRLAECADPIKIYEYLDLGLPIVTTGVNPPPGAERWVQRVDGVDDFIRVLSNLSVFPQGDNSAMTDFARSCSWPRRVDALLTFLASDSLRIAQKKALFRVSR